jgi:hypothetical protein
MQFSGGDDRRRLILMTFPLKGWSRRVAEGCRGTRVRFSEPFAMSRVRVAVQALRIR